ncbi:MAG TPA: TonB-dependent receptor [Longimicrobiales bacterium]
MRRTLLCVSLLLVGAPVAARAQDRPDTVRLRDLVVTATRLETRIGDAPGSVTIVSGDAMRESGHRFLIDGLRAVPGIALAQSAGPGALTALFIRGGEADYVQVLVDGVQVNDPGGAFDWAHLRTEDIERVEIVRGPASVLYGSDAVSGVVQIFTRAGGPPRIEVGATTARGDRHGTAAGEPFETHAVDASVTGRVAVPLGPAALVRYGLSVAHATSTGLFAFNSDYDNRNVSGRLQLETARGDVSLTTRVTDTGYHYPTDGGGAVVDRNQFAEGTTRSLGIDAGYQAAPAIELRLLATLHRTDSRTENPPDSSGDSRFWSTTDQLRRAIDARANVHLPHRTVLTVGAEREWQEAQTAFESTGGGFSFSDQTDEERANTGWYAQLHGTPVERVSVTIGARIDDNSAFGTFRTARAALSWRALAQTRLHVSFGTAFKEPTFFENFATGFARGNPDLEPERAHSWEAGAEYVLPNEAVTIGATWFEQRFRNLIQYTFNTPDPDAANYHNVGAARARGAELTAAVEVGRLLATGAYTYTYTRVSDDGFGEDPAFRTGRPMLRRPTHQAAITAALRLTSSLNARLAARWAGEREDLDFTDPAQFSGVRTTLPDYAILDAGVEYAILRGIRLSAGVRNLFDTDYEEIYNFPAPGRVFHLGIRAGTGL